MFHPVLAVLMLWSVFSVGVYVLVIVTLMRHRQAEPFDAAYFRLFVYAGYLDLVIIAYNTIWVKFPFLNWFPGPQMLAEPSGTWTFIGHLSAWIGSESQQLFILVIAFNRFIAICHPLRHAKIWTPKVVNLSSAACVISMLLVHAPQWTMDLRAGPNNETGGVELYHGNEVERKRVYLFGFLRVISYTMITAVLYVVTVVRMLKHKKKNQSVRMTEMVVKTEAAKKAELERRLALSSLVVFACQVFIVLYLCMVLVRGSNRGAIKYFYYVGSDLLNTVNPYSLLALSTGARKLIFDEIRSLRETSTVAVLK